MRNLLTVFLLLMALSSCDVGKRGDMDALLDRADSMNRAYIPMTDGIDSLLLDATRYYDRYGTPNQQVRAHYLLGCAYRDKGEAPAALQSYQDAIDRADTLNGDCDYRRLMSVYGQMAELFHAQNLPEDELAQRKRIGDYALLIGDSLLYIRNQELLVKPYFLMGDTTDMLKVLKQAREFYTTHGHSQEAAAVLAFVIDYNIAKDSLDEASDLMKVYEEQSGLFGKEGRIAPGREAYYYIKGSYYLKRHDYVLAEQWFRKLPSSKQKDAYKGLLSVFRFQNKLDSVAKYAYLYENALDTLHNKMQTEAIHQMSSMYNYQSFLKKADAESRKAERFWSYFMLSVFSIIIILLFAVVVGYILVQKKRRQEEEIQKIRRDYDDAIDKREQLAIEMEMLRTNHEQLIASEQETKSMLKKAMATNSQLMITKEKEIADLNGKICDYAKRLLHSDKIVGESPQFTLMIDDFHKKAERKKNTSLPTKLEWDKFLGLFVRTQPKAYVQIGRDQILSPKELKACVLLLLEFTNSEIMSLLDISSQNMTNIRTHINEKLFHESNAPTLDCKIKKIPIV